MSDKVILFPPEDATHDLVPVEGEDNLWRWVPKEKPVWQDRLELLELLEEHGTDWDGLEDALHEAGWTSDRVMELFHQAVNLREALDFAATSIACWESVAVGEAR